MRSRASRGFTLIELMATLALTSLIVASVLPVTVSLSRSQALAQRMSDTASRITSLRRLLALDLSNAEKYKPAGQGLVVATHAALKPDTLALQHLDATVRYEVRRIGTTGWLVRVQESALGGKLVERVCSGVRAIQIVPVGPTQPADPDGWVLMPQAMTVHVDFEAANAAPAEFRVQRRWPS